MRNKSQIKQSLLRQAIKIWGIKSSDQLDPVVGMLIEVFAALAYDNEGAISDIRERLLEQISSSLTQDHRLSANPAHSIMQAEPLEPYLELDRKSQFYTNKLTSLAAKYSLNTINFAPVVDYVRLVHGRVNYLLCERNLYSMYEGVEKELITKANKFNQDLNRTVWLGMTLGKGVTSLKNIHFYFDFPNTENQSELYELLKHCKWSIGDRQLDMEVGLPLQQEEQTSGGILGYYNKMETNDEEVMNHYRNQFLYIRNHIPVNSIEKASFPEELNPYFPLDRIGSLEPQLWFKIEFPTFFNTDDLDDIAVVLNTFPVSNKALQSSTLYRSKSLTSILPLPVKPGEYYLSIEHVEDSFAHEFKFLPYHDSTVEMGGTYTVKRGGMERFNKRNLSDNLELFTDLIRTEYATCVSFGMKNIDHIIESMGQYSKIIEDKVKSNEYSTPEVNSYILLEPEEKNKDNDVTAQYWTTNCNIANGITYATPFSPLLSLPIEKDSCILLKTTTGGRAEVKKQELLAAYKYALSTRDQLFSAHDVEMFCYMKFAEKVQHVKVRRGVAASERPKEGLIRVIEVVITPSDEHQSLFDAAAIGMLKRELDIRSPQMNRYKIVVESKKKE